MFEVAISLHHDIILTPQVTLPKVLLPKLELQHNKKRMRSVLIPT
jgi:hypothetical protein